MTTTHIPTPAPRIANGSWVSVLESHPRLLGPKGFIQERARRYPYLYDAIKQSRRDILLGAGIVQAVEGIDEVEIQEWIRKARQECERGATNQHQDSWIWLTNVAFTYDLFFDHISPEDRQRMIDWMNLHLESFTDDESAFHNSTPSKMLCYLRIAYATWGENPRAKEFRDRAIHKLYEQRFLKALQEWGAGGGWTECGWYQRHSVWHGAEALELARRIEGYDGFQLAAQFWYQRMAYEMHAVLPKLRPEGVEWFAHEGDGTDGYWQGDESPRLLSYLLAEYFRGSELSSYVMNRQRVAKAPLAKITEFLYRPELDQDVRRMDDFPLAHIAKQAGKVYARSDWSPDATWFRLECSDYWNGHQHFEVGNFEIFRHESLATEGGEYYDFLSAHEMNWYIRTIAHNCMLVHRPGETWDRMRDGGRNMPYANDGGQTKKWDWPPQTVEKWKEARESFHRGDLVAFENEAPFMFVAADCTPAYQPEKLALWIRQVVFVRPHTFVIFDRVVSTQPEYRKTWLLHSHHAPRIEGDTYTITRGQGQLTVQQLLPEHPRVTAAYGYTYDGRTFPPSGNRWAHTASLWRLEESPALDAKEDLFLHVLTTDEPVRAELIRDGDTAGARFGEVEVAFSGRVGGHLKIGRQTFALTETVHPGKYG